jgi:PAB-dependent poly(A)-specific ribonuclease subunit 3
VRAWFLTDDPGPLSGNAQLQDTVPEWAGQEFPEFVPQNFDPSHLMSQEDVQDAAGLMDPYDPYSLQSTLPSTPQPQLTNPYLQDTSGNLAGAAYYQNPHPFAQPASI